MSINVEIKARVADPAALRARVRNLAAGDPRVLRQEDTFFRVPSGRLKLRVIDGVRAELTRYDRDDEPGPTPSSYLIAPVADPVALGEVLSAALGVRGVVRKTRELFMVGRTRVHLDDVEGLGTFMELEVVLAPGESPAAGRAEARELLEALSSRSRDLADRAHRSPRGARRRLAPRLRGPVQHHRDGLRGVPQPSTHQQTPAVRRGMRPPAPHM